MPNCFTSSKSESRVAHMIVQRATASSTKTDELRTRTRRLRGQQRKRPAADRRPEYRGSSTRKLEYKWCTARVKSTQCTCTEYIYIYIYIYNVHCTEQRAHRAESRRQLRRRQQISGRRQDVRPEASARNRQAEPPTRPQWALFWAPGWCGSSCDTRGALAARQRDNRVVSHCSMRSCCHRRLPKPIAHVSMYE